MFVCEICEESFLFSKHLDHHMEVEHGALEDESFMEDVRTFLNNVVLRHNNDNLE